ncbi:serine dehydratase beta chain [Aeromicrobium piscarium]|uniref:serine dehydratase beta chain n=1 Tax=Aeromicrobium piscarium TaxID=2590901 RepID=UPI003CCC8544
MGLTATQVEHGVYVSVLDLFSIGIGPSSSHTVGPMRAAARFRQVLGDRPVDALQCTLHGSLGATGHGHGTPAAVVGGLAGAAPESVDPDTVLERWTRLQAGGAETILGARLTARDIVFAPLERPFGHPNSMTFEA